MEEKKESEEDDDDPIDFEEIMGNLKEPLNLTNDKDAEMNDQYFKFEQQQHTLLYTFKDKNVHSFYNLLGNFVSSQLTSGNRFSV